VRAKAAPIDRTLILKDKIWTARLRIDHVAIFQASASRVFKAVALIVLAAAADSVVIASVAAVVTDSVAAGALGALADSAGAVDSGADDEIMLGIPLFFSKPQT
jgi:hypothetical protein